MAANRRAMRVTITSIHLPGHTHAALTLTALAHCCARIRRFAHFLYHAYIPANWTKNMQRINRHSARLHATKRHRRAVGSDGFAPLDPSHNALRLRWATLSAAHNRHGLWLHKRPAARSLFQVCRRRFLRGLLRFCSTVCHRSAPAVPRTRCAGFATPFPTWHRRLPAGSSVHLCFLTLSVST